IAKVKEGERGFQVVCAGGLSNSPQAAITLHEFIGAGEIGRVGEAILRLFDRLGNRENRHRARLKYVLRKLGEAEFRATYARVRDEVDQEATQELVEAPQPDQKPAGPVASDQGEPRSRSDYLRWRSTSVIAQKQPGYIAAYVRLALGDI